MTFRQHVPVWAGAEPYTVEGDLETILAHPRLVAWATRGPAIAAKYLGQVFDGWYAVGPHLIASYDGGGHTYLVGDFSEAPGLPRWPGRVLGSGADIDGGAIWESAN